MAPKVSINLCCYNSEKYLRETLDSIVDQTHTDWELIVINDGSTDSTETIIQGYRRGGCPIVYHYQENRGLAYARNKALELSGGEYIAFIDHDDVWVKTKLDVQVRTLTSHPKAVLTFGYSDALLADGTHAPLNRSKIINLPFSSFSKEHNRQLLLRYGCFIAVSSVMVRSEQLSLAGGFNSHRSYIEDYDLWLRLAGNYDFSLIPEVLSLWRRHDDQSTVTINQRALAEEIEINYHYLKSENLDMLTKTHVIKNICKFLLRRSFNLKR